MRYHRHQCPNPACGHVWRHSTGPKNKGNIHAHMCPKCGEVQTEVLIKDRSPKSIRGVRKVLKRALAHALASNLKPVIVTQFSPCGEDARLLNTHGLITVTLRYPYKPSRRMPRD